MKMKSFLARETKFFELPLTLKSRLLILVAVVVLLPIYFFPLWNMSSFQINTRMVWFFIFILINWKVERHPTVMI